MAMLNNQRVIGMISNIASNDVSWIANSPQIIGIKKKPIDHWNDVTLIK